MTFKVNQLIVTQILIVILGVLMVTQFAGLVSYSALNADEQGIIAANDSDAEWVILKAIKTRWWKDNGWAQYGPFYFRLAHSMQNFLGTVAEPKVSIEVGEPSIESRRERTAHFVLQVISISSIFAISGILAWLAVASWPWRLVTVISLVTAILNNKTWAEFLLRAHPDELFAFLVATAGVLILFWLKDQENSIRLRVVAAVWGVAVATKLTVAVMVPGFLVLFFPPFTRKRLKLLLQFIGWAFLGYFLIGFPQTIVLDRPVRFLMYQNKFSVLGDWQSLVNWATLYFSQVWRPLIVLFVAVLVDGRQWIKLNSRDVVRFLGFVFIPLAALFARHILSPYQHYPFPWVALSWVAFIFILSQVGGLTALLGRLNHWLVLSGLVVVISIVGVIPPTLQAELNKLMECRAEIRQAQAKVVELMQAGKKASLDPYFPYRTSLKDQYDITWTRSLAALDAGQFVVIGLAPGFYRRYTGSEVSEYVKRDDPSWKVSHEFYGAVMGHQQFQTPAGRTFEKIYEDSCGRIIYQTNQGKK